MIPGMDKFVDALAKRVEEKFERSTDALEEIALQLKRIADALEDERESAKDAIAQLTGND